MKINEFDDREKSNFLDLKAGDNKLRIVSEFEPRYTHFDGRKFLGSCNQNVDCVHCNNGNKASVKFLCHVIDRTDNTFKIGQLGATVLKQLKQFSLNPEYTFQITPPWDCTIQKTGEGLETKYAVIPSRNNTELTAEEQELIKALKPIRDIVMAMNKGKKKSEGQATLPEGEKEVNVEDIPF